MTQINKLINLKKKKNVFVLMLTGFCSSVFIFVVTVMAIVFVAGVDLDPNRKMSPTFPNPHVI